MCSRNPWSVFTLSPPKSWNPPLPSFPSTSSSSDVSPSRYSACTSSGSSTGFITSSALSTASRAAFKPRSLRRCSFSYASCSSFSFCSSASLLNGAPFSLASLSFFSSSAVAFASNPAFFSCSSVSSAMRLASISSRFPLATNSSSAFLASSFCLYLRKHCQNLARFCSTPHSCIFASTPHSLYFSINRFFPLSSAIFLASSWFSGAPPVNPIALILASI
mmetsp:Transcript_2870/g.5159  ORF Transcript_2870/g.5159 Transcript_2870/m.5159 type:complete len:220 (+) Transcript_2870:842-1501(+)